MLKDPEARRGLRTIVQSIVSLVLLYFIWSWGPMLERPALERLLLSLVALLAIDKVGNVMENGLRAFKLSAGKDGVSVEADGER